ncbi:MAG TPA: hypothetical protein VE623_14910 [Acidimicrobiales bacterium]|nr:hypothetical protein [Acidimicrobiales bacterium]
MRVPLEELAAELDSEQIRTQLVVTLVAESRVSEGADADLWLDPTRMHLFDPASRPRHVGTPCGAGGDSPALSGVAAGSLPTRVEWRTAGLDPRTTS